MKITKLRKGYRIVCTDNEFGALVALVDNGLADLENDASLASLAPAVKRVIRGGRFAAVGGPLTVDDDRRATD